MVATKHSIGKFRIGLILIDGFALMSYSSIVEPLRAANLICRRAYYDIKYIPVTGSWAHSSSGASVKATGRIGQEGDFDLVLVVAGGHPASFKDTKLFQWLRTLSRRGVNLGGVSGGPVILASAGVMEGRRMTVHWEHAAALAESRTGLMIERSLYVIDRARFTCAGGIAPLDMMHALLTEHHGPADDGSVQRVGKRPVEAQPVEVDEVEEEGGLPGMDQHIPPPQPKYLTSDQRTNRESGYVRPIRTRRKK